MTVRRAYHARVSALLFVVVTLLLGAGAANSQNNLLFLVFGLAVGALLVSGIVSGQMMMGLTIRRELPAVGSVGEPLTIRYEVTNSNRFFPGFALRVSEVRSASFLPGASPAPTWQALIPPPNACVANVSAGESVSVFATVAPHRRGAALFTGVRLTSAFPFGIVTKSVSVEHRGVIPILPRVVRLRRDATAALLGRAEVGASAAPQRGRGEDFYGLREYSPGDSRRAISWRASARLGSLVVREHAAPRAGILMIVLNMADRPLRARGWKDVDEPLEDAITLVASLLVDALARGMDAGLAVPDQKLLFPPASGSRHRAVLLSALASIDAQRSRAGQADTDEIDAVVARLAPQAARVVVHAGPVDPTVGPHDARHLSSIDLLRLTLETDRAAPVLAAGAAS